MKKKSKKANAPRRNKNAEIVLKTFPYLWGSDASEDCIEIPGLLILANRAGFKWLSQYFAQLADRDWTLCEHATSDPDDHQHLDLAQPPIDPSISEKIEIRLGCISPENRRAVFERYEIMPKPRAKRVRAARSRSVRRPSA